MEKNISDFHHNISGKEGAPWVIFLHGLLGYGANWRRITPHFEDKYRVLLFDQRGHGRSMKPGTGHYRPEDYASDVLFLMDHFDISQALLVGHSMGGRNALCFTTAYPERVKKLVIEDIGPEAQPDSLANMRELLESVPVPFKNKFEAKSFLLSEFKEAKLGQYLYSNLIETEDGKITWQFSVADMLETIREGRTSDRWNEWHAVQCPVLIIRGENSDELSREVYERMLHESRVAQGIEIKGTGHWVHFEKPDEFARDVLKFFES